YPPAEESPPGYRAPRPVELVDAELMGNPKLLDERQWGMAIADVLCNPFDAAAQQRLGRELLRQGKLGDGLALFSKQRRERWNFRGGHFVRTDETSWVEQQANYKRTYREVDRTWHFVEISATDNSMSFRLYASHCEWKTPQTKGWEY